MSKRTRNLYAWRSITKDGRKRQVEAHLFGAQWRFSSICKDEDAPTVHEPPSLGDLKDLEEMIFNKYQRKHAHWDHVLSVRALIKARGGPRRD